MAGLDAFNIIKTISPEIATEIRKSLNNPAYVAQLQQYRDELGSLVKTIQLRSKNQQVVDQKYLNYLNEVSGIAQAAGVDVNAWSTIQRTRRNNQQELRLLLGKLFVLEHQIMSFLTNHMSDTVNYSIYYTSDFKTGEIARITMSAEQLYEFLDKTGWNVHKNNIRLSYDQIQKMIADIPLETETVDFSKVARAVIESAKTELASYQKELAELEDISAKEHLGKERWKRYNALRRNVGNATQADLLYTKYTSGVVSAAMMAEIQNTTHYTSAESALRSVSGQSLGVNRGHLAEAVERLIQNPDLDVSTAVAESLGNLPWYYGGDVNVTQVKGIFDKRAYVQLSSLSSIVELAAELMIMLTNPNVWAQQVEAVLTNQILNQAASQGADANLDAFIEYFGKEKVKEILRANGFG